MTLLHDNIAAIYDTRGWKCVNTYADGDGVVFLRPPPPLPVRGAGLRCSAQTQEFQVVERNGRLASTADSWHDP